MNAGEFRRPAPFIHPDDAPSASVRLLLEVAPLLLNFQKNCLTLMPNLNDRCAALSRKPSKSAPASLQLRILLVHHIARLLLLSRVNGDAPRAL